MNGPLHHLEERLPVQLKGIVERETPIPSIAERARELQAANPKLVRADIGQISGIDSELEVYYGTPVGLDAARELVAESWNISFELVGRDGFGDGLSKNNVAITTGAAEALACALRATAHDKVVAIPRNYWENYRNGVEAAGGEVVFVDYFDDEGRLDIEGIRKSLRASKAEVLLANFPANPTGAVLSASEAAALGELIRELDLLVVADEVYARMRFDDEPPQSLLMHAPDHVIAVSSASKEYLLPGARVGFAISAVPSVTNRIIRKLIRTGTGSPNVLGQQRLIEILERDLTDMRAGRPPQVLTKVRDEMARRKAGLVEVLRKHEFSLRGRAGHEPQGTIFLMVDVPDWFDGDDEMFVASALEANCVSCVPGGAFGMPGALRFSFGGMTAEAIAQLDENLTAFRG